MCVTILTANIYVFHSRINTMERDTYGSLLRKKCWRSSPLKMHKGLLPDFLKCAKPQISGCQTPVTKCNDVPGVSTESWLIWLEGDSTKRFFFFHSLIQFSPVSLRGGCKLFLLANAHAHFLLSIFYSRSLAASRHRPTRRLWSAR